MKGTRIDELGVVDSCIIDHSVDHDVFVFRPRKEVVIEKKELPRNIPQVQEELIEI